eukprot:CAMPEP_0118928854 /NCGR_PEP_ID=MMETSP1169-20130426/6005_1 /TAXON_ID=36882 /ORGANISM="Pyramimonas obovata, Strain CCMP722" /LENGTH=479 /DNA_ID=CAMNT_0006870925 /DNA_START=363 /DNA_END=1799 /DNA_ORIENTATION=-
MKISSDDDFVREDVALTKTRTEENSKKCRYREKLQEVGFKVAKATTNATLRTAVFGAKTGFSLARGWCDVSSKAVEGAVKTLPMFSRISPLVNSTHTKMSFLLDISESLTMQGMKISGLAMESWLKYLTGRQILEEGTELAGMTETVLGFFNLLKEFVGDLRGLGIMDITRAMYAIACLQRVFGPLSVPCPTGFEGELLEDMIDGHERTSDMIDGHSDTSTESRSSKSSAGDSPSSRQSSSSSCPPAWQMDELHIMSTYSMASYGRLFLSVAERKPELLRMSEERVIALYTGGEAEWVLHRAEATMFRPAHFVAVDHDIRMVVVAVRGTLGVSDTLCDLCCESAPLRVGSTAGRVHSGFLKAAETLDAELADKVAAILERYPRYRLRLCGHSMGAGISALLAALWVERFPQLQCYGFGAAAAGTLDLSRALAPHCTSVVLGNDFVPRLSLGSCQDLRNAIFALCVDSEPGLMDRITGHA